MKGQNENDKYLLCVHFCFHIEKSLSIKSISLIIISINKNIKEYLEK